MELGRVIGRNLEAVLLLLAPLICGEALYLITAQPRPAERGRKRGGQEGGGMRVGVGGGRGVATGGLGGGVGRGGEVTDRDE